MPPSRHLATNENDLCTYGPRERSGPVQLVRVEAVRARGHQGGTLRQMPAVPRGDGAVHDLARSSLT